jgi:hypothetical protein
MRLSGEGLRLVCGAAPEWTYQTIYMRGSRHKGGVDELWAAQAV